METIYGCSKEDVKLIGKWYITLTGPDGQVKDYRAGKNVITTNGLDFLASFLGSAAAGACTFTMKYVGIGTDSTSETAAQTALLTQTERHTGTVSYTSSAIYRVTATFPSGTAGAIVEYGLFSSSTGGTMLSRDTEALITKGLDDTLTVTTEITFA
jgi:hypothetical protein